VTSDHVDIRPYRPDDLDDLYRVCLLTGDNGHDATLLFSDPKLPGHVWVGPYVTLEPSLAFVAEDAEGVGGYVLAALDSRAFADRCERDWWPPLRAVYPEPPPDEAARLPTFEGYALHDIHHYFGPPDEVLDRFPSHMHIDLVPRLQGRGIGRQMVGRLIAALRDQGSPGLHLLVGSSNPRAVGFYRHIGFTEFQATDPNIFTIDLHIFTMDLAQ